jgi:hypothetical protein
VFACLLGFGFGFGFGFGLSFAYWSLEIGLKYERIYGYRRRHGCSSIPHPISRISHLAPRISHLASRIPPLVSFVSFSTISYLSLVISLSHCRAATVFASSESPPPPLSSATFCMSMFLYGRSQRREGCKDTDLAVLVRSGLTALRIAVS